MSNVSLSGKVVGLFSSLRLTVVLLALAMVLVFVGTLAQIDKDIWTVMAQYFRCAVAWIDLYVFFPRTWHIPSIQIPFPGGFLIGTLLAINLLAAHLSRYRISARGGRLLAGVLVLLLGVLATAAVMFGWGTASVAETQSDAFWRVFWRLGRGGLAALVLYGASWLLYDRRAGLALLHAGIIFLMCGEFVTALHAVEASMTIKQGETVNFIDHSRQMELAFTDHSDPSYDRVTAIPASLLKPGALISRPELPFDIRVVRFMVNSSQPVALASEPEAVRARYPQYEGYGSRLYVAEEPENSDEGGRNAPAVDIELVDRASGKSLGRYILSLWFYPNFVNRAWDMPQTIAAGGKTYEAYLRNRREYLRSPDGSPYSIKLLDFRHENYEGTQVPKDFSSRILLSNPGDHVERELKIWMNNPLRYAQRTFYQSGYLPDDSGTILQVVRNDTWMIPYLSCMIVLVGMAAQFIQSLRRDQRGDA